MELRPASKIIEKGKSKLSGKNTPPTSPVRLAGVCQTKTARKIAG